MTDLTELGYRAMTRKAWRWMDGMLVVHPAEHAGATGFSYRVSASANEVLKGDFPDFSDPATAGCLLALVFELEGRRVWPNTAAINLAVYGPTHAQTIESLVAALDV